MNAVDALSVLCSQGRRGSHGIAAMGGDHFLIGFEPSNCGALAPKFVFGKLERTYAPPELSEPAITSMRFIAGVVPVCKMLAVTLKSTA